MIQPPQNFKTLPLQYTSGMFDILKVLHMLPQALGRVQMVITLLCNLSASGLGL